MSGSACCSSYPECTAACALDKFMKYQDEKILPTIQKIDAFVTKKFGEVEEDVNSMRTEVRQQGDLLAKSNLQTKRQEATMALR